MKFHILGAINPGSEYSEDVLVQTNLGEEIALSRDSEFLGKPGTRIVAVENHILKLNTEKAGELKAAKIFAEESLRAERRLGVYHPQKTWFVLEQDKVFIPGNLTPRMQPCHEQLQKLDEPSVIAFFSTYFDVYLRTFKEHQIALDEGLSNFGLDSEGRFFYLDDDYYDWNQYTSLSNFLGVLIRQYPGWQLDSWYQLGDLLGQSFVQVIRDLHQLYELDQKLRALLMVNDNQESALQALRDGLLHERHDPRVILNEEETQTNLDFRQKTWAIIADIHGNLPALQAVLAELDKLGVSQGLVLGDLVGYGPFPNECVELIRSRGFKVIMGNHDESASKPEEDLTGMSSMAAVSMKWTRTCLNDENKQWLAKLPRRLQTDDWIAVHGAPVDPGSMYGYIYRLTFRENLDYLAGEGVNLCFYGHTHSQGCYSRSRGTDEWYEAARFLIRRDDEINMICPGSVGQPRNRDNRAQFSLYTPDDKLIEHCRLEYDMTPCLEKLEAEGLPKELANRLKNGI